MKLPLELIQEIVLYIKFQKIVLIFPKIAHYVYDKRKHSRLWAKVYLYPHVIKWLDDNNIIEDLDYCVIDNNGHLHTNYNNIDYNTRAFINRFMACFDGTPKYAS